MYLKLNFIGGFEEQKNTAFECFFIKNVALERKMKKLLSDFYDLQKEKIEFEIAYGKYPGKGAGKRGEKKQNVETVTICKSTSYIIVSDRLNFYFRNQIIIVY